MSGSSYGQTFRSQPSSPSEASASSSPKSLTEGSNRTSLDTTLKSEHIHDSIRDGREEYARQDRSSRHNNDTGIEELGPRRRRQRNSGGFLLDSLQSPNHRTGVTNINSTEKGKGKEEGMKSHIIGGKARQHAAHRSKPSIGSSPLATKVTNAATQQDQDLNRFPSRLSTIHRKSHNLADVVPADPAQANSDTKLTPDDGEHIERSGFVTDPAQIVNLALNLSESRRRQFSLSRMSPLDPVTNRRVISSTQLGVRHPSSTYVAVGGSSKVHMQQQRFGSRNVSSNMDRLEPAQITIPQSSTSQEQTRSYELPVAPSLGLDLVHNLDISPSDATLLRAERAQLFLELGYEYRRLLQYLPKLPTPSQYKSDTSKGLGKKTIENSEILGRAYNPIQFIRNRKVRRGHDRKTYNAEAEGWKNIAKVRSWVNVIAGEREDQVSKVDDKFPLPSFSIEQEEPIAEGPSPPSSIGHSRGLTATKVARPRSDWITTPWDMLADAYWLDRDDNKRLIEDRDGNKLFQPKKASGEPTSRISQEAVRSATRRSESLARPSQSPNKISPMVSDVHDEYFRERGRRRHRFRDSISSLQDYGGSQDRNSRWQRRLIRSRSSSSSGSSVPGSLNRLTQARDYRDSRERQDSAVLEKQVLDLLAKEAENLDWGSMENINNNAVNSDKTDSTVPESKHNGATQTHKTSNLELADSEALNNHRKLTEHQHKRVSIEEQPEQRGRRPRTSLEEFDTTAPNSPTGGGFVPSIAINLSPPASRSPSPKKLSSFNYSRSRDRQSKGRHAIEETDFATEPESATNGPLKVSTNAYPSVVDREPPTSSSDGLLSPKSAAEGIGRILRHRRSESKSIRNSKDQKEPESRFRGFVKGGRLAEIIGSEVSRVGDLLWRKDVSNQGSTIASPISSQASDMSESEEDTSGTGLKKRPGNGISSNNANEEETRKLLRKPTNEESPKYHMNNLPTFKSPFRKEENDTVIARGDDPITKQQAALRERGRPSRFNRLAPPNLDMRGVSPSPSPPQLSRVITYDTDATNDGSRRNSTNPSESSAGRADRQFNTISGLPEKLGNGGPPVTGLASLDIRRRRSAERPKLEGNRQWSISDRGLSAVRGAVTDRDITRTRALLLSSGVKANEIVRRAYEIRDPPSVILQDLQRTMKTPLPRVPKSQEYMLAARLIVKNIAETNKRIRETAEDFSNVAVNELHDRIKAIDERITSQLTPSLRASADDADALSTELATSHRLNVKRLNDSIDQILRQKRRRFRWVRRGGYLLLEWMLLGAMWWVWLIVVIIRLVRGTVGGIYRGTRWLLWL